MLAIDLYTIDYDDVLAFKDATKHIEHEFPELAIEHLEEIVGGYAQHKFILLLVERNKDNGTKPSLVFLLCKFVVFQIEIPFNVALEKLKATFPLLFIFLVCCQVVCS